ncbi:hypothetical protein HO173_011156 [Letharia columbiana]|uniref:Uncharacterized protein n=1 Tax=Letharia columbiana TaxID=112416 RepID=A0A8H6FLA0_9LECA|nr:uncharacterized protein HO173_011156 [Letharia columbiana]KAF6230619.1 hypothetical protein HO173_011156 [Letharia columbiana]
MPVTTRSQANTDANQGNGRPRGENEIEQNETRPPFNENEAETFYPVFCLTEIPDEYTDELVQYTDEYSRWIGVTSNDPKNVLADIEANVGRLRPTPFIGYTMRQVYGFFKRHLRPAENYNGPDMRFPNFTFIVVDERCVRSRPRQIIICCDAPDFGERSTKLKLLRLPIDQALDNLCPLEQLAFTVSTIGHPSGKSRLIMPPPRRIPWPDRPGRYRWATAAEARKIVRGAIRGWKTADEALGKVEPFAIASGR